MRISKKYLKIAEGYLYFSKSYDHIDDSDEAMRNMYSYETFGHPRIKYNELQENGKYNAYAIGKHWMDVTIAMWREDIINGNLIKFELLNDPDIPDFIKTIIPKLPIENFDK